jgi:hypothetical protein
MKLVKIVLSLLVILSLTACSANSPELQTSQGDLEELNAKILILETEKTQLESEMEKLKAEIISINEARKLEKEQLEAEADEVKAIIDALEGDVKRDGAVLTTLGAKSVIEDRATAVMYTLRDANFSKLSEYVHPTKGVRFTAITTVNPDTDQTFSASEVAVLIEDSSKYVWGKQDGTGEDILFSPFSYYENYIYKVDYLNAPQVSYNEQLGYGNSIDNSAEVYPGSVRVEYYYPGFEEQYAGMDWTSLRLVFEEYKDGKWYLVGIIHNMWTI